ncbi:MAG: hypothetical protein R3237_01105 [Nitrosopumilaceae archaeon]|nr:hypothetical protein [Nitrosopumilaceae archaeon]
MDRIKRLSYEVLDQHKSKFGENFSDNKKLLDELTIIRSKGLKNEVAGYITKFIKSEKRNQEIKNAQAEAMSEEIKEEPIVESHTETTQESEETVIEVGVEDPVESKPNESSEETN